MNERHFIDLGFPSLLVFHGPDAERYLNGQLTQDVRKVAAGDVALPSCVTDAKARLQFRVWITRAPDGAFRVQGEPGQTEALEARLTRYLIADDVEVEIPEPAPRLVHLTGDAPVAPDGVVARNCARFGGPGTDWWFPAGVEPAAPEGWAELAGDALEAFRIGRGVPAWGRELTEGLLPPEAGLEAGDISYQKGCYIGQEVISRMKRAGKTNKRLVRFLLDGPVPDGASGLVTAEGADAGFLTSVSPLASADGVPALGYVKRGAGECFVPLEGGGVLPARML